VNAFWTHLKERGFNPEIPRDASWGERYFHSKTTLAGLTYAMPTVVSRDLRVISHRGEMFLSVLDFHCRDPDNSVFRRLALGSVHLALAFRRAKFLRQTQVA
jgi:hypothetical protein